MAGEGPEGPPPDELFEVFPDGLIWVDPSGRVLRVGGGEVDAFGGPLAALVGTPLPTPASCPQLGEVVRRCLVEGTDQRCEWVDPGPAPRAWEVRARAVSGGGLLIVRDLTATWRSGPALDAEKERMAVTLRSIADAVVTTDADDRIVMMNPAAEALFGVQLERARGKAVEEVLGPAYLDSWGGVRPRVERVDADGHRRVSQVRFAPVVQDGRQVGGVYTLRDVTDEQGEIERLRASKLESVGLLAGGIAHDFNNLLAAIQGNVSVLRELAADHEVREILDDVDLATRRAAALTRQLLTFAVGGAPVKAVGTLDRIVRDAVDVGLRGSNVRRDVALAPDLYPVEVDRGQMVQVLQNLVSNACQAMPDGGRLRVSARNVSHLPTSLDGALGPWVAIAISDQGVGIPDGDLARIFDPFFSTRPEGTGLGLAAAYAIVRRHGGHLVVQSTQGVGSTFTVYLPASQVAAPDAEEGAEALGPPLRGRVLVVDDDPLLGKVAKRLLESLGLQVVSCTDGEAGIEAYQAATRRGERFDVVLLDLTVPGGLGGREAVKRLLAIDPAACCVATSGYASDPVFANHGAHGFRGCLEKPFAKADAARVLRALIPRTVPGPPR